MFGACSTKLALVGDVGVGARKSGKEPQDRQLRAFFVFGYKHGERHIGAGTRRGVAIDALNAAVATVLLDCFQCGSHP